MTVVVEVCCLSYLFRASPAFGLRRSLRRSSALDPTVLYRLLPVSQGLGPMIIIPPSWVRMLKACPLKHAILFNLLYLDLGFVSIA